MKKEISVVVPLYKEVGSVDTLLAEIDSVLKSYFDQYEIITVDDGSQDGTYEKLLAAQKRFSHLIVLGHKNNSTQGIAIYTGVTHAKFSLVATLDGDGQNDPRDIIKFFKILKRHHPQQGGTMIIGHRQNRTESRARRWGSKIANFSKNRLFQDGAIDGGCGLKLFWRADFLKLPPLKEMHRFISILLHHQGVHILNVPVHSRDRFAGTTKYTLWRRFLWVLRIRTPLLWLLENTVYPTLKKNPSRPTKNRPAKL